VTAKTLALIAAPTSLQPGGYVPKAYSDRVNPSVESARFEVQTVPQGRRILLSWSCPEPVRELTGDVDHFVDAAALAIPATPDAPWISMGAPGKAVEGALWRADREALLQFHAEGLGTVKRQPAPDAWQVAAEWRAGEWSVRFDLAAWPHLERNTRLAFAIWRGATADRGGLKSVSSGWVRLEP
jgi:DMSO reductase family type II enzyme heme b subunit